jgi:hypothetical protein
MSTKGEVFSTLILDLLAIGVIGYGSVWALKIDDYLITHWFLPICWIGVIGNLLVDLFTITKNKRKTTWNSKFH